MVLPKTIPNTKVIPLEIELFREIGIVLKNVKQASPSIKKFVQISQEYFK
jgi:hypothetical protein